MDVRMHRDSVAHRCNIVETTNLQFFDRFIHEFWSVMANLLNYNKLQLIKHRRRITVVCIEPFKQQLNKEVYNFVMLEIHCNRSWIVL